MTRQRRSSNSKSLRLRGPFQPDLPVVGPERLRCGRRRVGIGHSIVVGKPHDSLPSNFRRPSEDSAAFCTRHGLERTTDSVVSGAMKAGEDERRGRKRGKIRQRSHPCPPDPSLAVRTTRQHALAHCVADSASAPRQQVSDATTHVRPDAGARKAEMAAFHRMIGDSYDIRVAGCLP